MPHCRPTQRTASVPLRVALLSACVLAVACGGGGEAGDPTPPPPPATVPALQLKELTRTWEFFRFDSPGREQSRITPFPPPKDEDGGRFDEESELGPLPFNAPLGDNTARVEAYSNENGMTWWVGAQAPSGRGPATPGIVGSEVQFEQRQGWVKKAANARLEYVITHVQLDLIDSNAPGSLTFDECPWGEDFSFRSCDETMLAGLYFRFTARADRTPGVFDAIETLLAKDGDADLRGWRAHWQPYADEDWDGAWTEKDFVFDYDLTGGGELAHARVKLREPIVLKVPVAQLPVGSEIYVTSWIRAFAHNNRQRESYAGLWFRDPAQVAGMAVIAEGVEPAPVSSALAVEPERVDDTPVCAGAARPEAGMVSFAEAEVVAGELPGRGARITLVRTGGSAGAVSVGFATRDGTAKAGSDYVALERRVRFRDGETRKSVHVPMALDAVAEPSETVLLELSDPRGCAALGSMPTATLKILDDDRAAPPPPPTYTVGGTVSGLVGSGLVLEDRQNAISLAPTGNGQFTFARPYGSGAAYDVRVKTQPGAPVQVCSVTRGSGTVAAANVTDVAVNCAAPPPVSGLDASFGSGGRATGGLLGSIRTIALQSDGRIVGGGGTRLARWSATGVPDAGFAGGAGEVTSVFGGLSDELFEVVVQPDDRILVAGRSLPTTATGPLQAEFAVARFLPDGTRDLSFGSGGVVLAGWDAASDEATRVLLQPDGRIVLVGTATTLYTPSQDDSAFGLIRLNADGSTDSSFGTGGRAVVQFEQIDRAYAAALQPDGRIVVAGRISENLGDESDVGIARLNADGTTDTSFGNGKLRLDLSPNWDEAVDLVVQPDGRIALLVAYSNVGQFEYAVLRLEADGGFDTSFGTGGLVRLNVGPLQDYGRALVRLSDGKLVIAGQASSATVSDFGLFRLHADGTPDTGFGNGGLLLVDFFGALDSANDLLVQPDGKLLAAGTARNGLSAAAALVRIHP